MNWMDVRDAYIEIKRIKVAKWGIPKEKLKNNNLKPEF
jgi:hypothetical protein